MKPRMKRRTGHQQQYWTGSLPARAPLANPYVPFQDSNPQTYEARKGLARGTMFPGLDLPFMGMVNEPGKKDTPMMQLQTVGFAINELALYLDTHRDDTEALELYRQYQQMYRRMSEQFAMDSGPLTHLSLGNGTYRWLDDPWPWEYCANREG